MVGSFLVAFVLAGASLGRGVSLETGPHVSSAADVNPFLPLFEFAPASGVGLDPLGSCNCQSTNLTTFPQDIDNAAWTRLGVTSAAPVVTANFAQDPTGAFGAERVQIASCAAVGTASTIFQISLGASGASVASLYCRGTYANQTISVCADQNVNGVCATVTCLASSWTRFSQVGSTASNGGLVFGCNHLATYSGSSNTGTADVLIWGGNYTNSASLLPYVAVPEANTGATMVFSRASTATCLATVGASPQTIANGDLVTCATGQPRVMPGADGSPDAGLLVEGQRTDSLLRSQEFDNVAWTKSNAGSSLPIVTANVAIAPDGTLTADRIQFAAAAAGERSIVFQSSVTGGVLSGSVFLKGNGASGALDLCVHQTAGNSYVCVTCAFNSSSWSRCLDENVTDTAITFIVGTDPLDHTGIPSRAAADVFVWGADCEVGAYATSYIATTTVPAARSNEFNNATGTFTSMTNSGCVAATFVPPTSFTNSTVGTVWGPILWFGTNGRPLYGQNGTGAVLYDGTNNPVVSVGTVTTAGKRFASDWASSTSTAHVYNVTDSLSTASAFAGVMANAGKLGIGSDYGNDGPYFAWGVIKQVVADSSTTRCR